MLIAPHPRYQPLDGTEALHAEISGLADLEATLATLGFRLVGGFRKRIALPEPSPDAEDYVARFTRHTREGRLVTAAFTSSDGSTLVCVTNLAPTRIEVHTLFADGVIVVTEDVAREDAASVRKLPTFEGTPEDRFGDAAMGTHGRITDLEDPAAVLAAHRDHLREVGRDEAVGVVSVRTLDDVLTTKRILTHHTQAADWNTKVEALTSALARGRWWQIVLVLGSLGLFARSTSLDGPLVATLVAGPFVVGSVGLLTFSTWAGLHPVPGPTPVAELVAGGTVPTSDDGWLGSFPEPYRLPWFLSRMLRRP